LISLLWGSSQVDAVPTENLEIEIDHLRLRLKEPGVIDILEVVRFSTTPNIPDKITISLPEGYSDFSLLEGLEGETFAEGDGQFSGRLEPGPGGILQVKFSYLLPLGDFPQEFSRKVGFNTHSILVLIEGDTGLGLTGSGFEFTGVVDMGGRKFYAYQHGPIEAGGNFGFDLKPLAELMPGGTTATETPPAADSEGQVAGSGDRELSQPLLNQGFHRGNANVRVWMRLTGTPGHWGTPGIVAMGLVLAALVWVGVRLVRRKGEQVSSADEGQGTEGLSERDTEDLTREKDRLLHQLADLDRKYDAGELEKEPYLSLRNKYKQELVAVMKELKEREG